MVFFYGVVEGFFDSFSVLGVFSLLVGCIKEQQPRMQAKMQFTE